MSGACDGASSRTVCTDASCHIHHGGEWIGEWDGSTESRRLVEDALWLCMYGERAPGGAETWAEWTARAEKYLRRGTGDE
jgi:hypothetical protein